MKERICFVYEKSGRTIDVDGTTPHCGSCRDIRRCRPIHSCSGIGVYLTTIRMVT